LWQGKHVKPDIPKWRVWFSTILACLWGILAIDAARRALRTDMQGDWGLFALCIVLFLWNVWQLWTFTRRPQS
jgi:membrane protein YdbS with pleckstrin-like domain